jgi:hypothetical protein
MRGFGTPSAHIANAFITNSRPKGSITSKLEAFMAVALMSWESAGFTANEEWAVVEEADRPRRARYMTNRTVLKVFIIFLMMSIKIKIFKIFYRRPQLLRQRFYITDKEAARNEAFCF